MTLLDQRSIYESLMSDHPSYTTTPMWFWGWSYKKGSTLVLITLNMFLQRIGKHHFCLPLHKRKQMHVSRHNKTRRQQVEQLRTYCVFPRRCHDETLTLLACDCDVHVSTCHGGGRLDRLHTGSTPLLQAKNIKQLEVYSGNMSRFVHPCRGATACFH